MLLLSHQQQKESMCFLSFHFIFHSGCQLSLFFVFAVKVTMCYICACIYNQTFVLKEHCQFQAYLSLGDNVFQAQLGISVFIFVIIFQFSFFYLSFFCGSKKHI